MKNFGKIVDPKDMVTKEYVDKFLPLSGGHVTGPVTFGDSITVDEATIGDLVVNGNASFTNNIQANKINGVTVGNNPKFTDTLATATTTGSGNAITAVSATNGALTFTKGSTFLLTSDIASWAKASTKPTYTASEVGALPNNTTYVSTITTAAGTHTAISNKSGAVSFNVPTKTSHLTNDSGFITNAGVTGVKGNAESNYRTGQVNLTPANLGAVATTGDETIAGKKSFSDILQIQKTIRDSSGQHYYGGAANRSRWYKITLAHNGVTPPSLSQWYMCSMTLHMAGDYQYLSRGTIELCYYIYWNGSSYLADKVFATGYGANINKTNIYYALDDPFIIYIDTSNPYTSLWVDYVSYRDSAQAHNTKETKVETTSEITIANYSQVPVSSIYTYDGSSLFVNSSYFLPNTSNTEDLGSSTYKWRSVYATTFNGSLTGNVIGNVSGSAGSVPWSGVNDKPTATQSATTGISISDHNTGSIIGVQSTTTTASKVTFGPVISIPNVTSVGSASNWVFEDITVPKAASSTACDDITSWSAGSGSASLTMTMDTTDTKKLIISFSHTHTAPTLNYTARSITGVSGSTTASHVKSGGNGSAPTLGTAISVPNVTGASDVTVPIKNASSTTVVTGNKHTITDSGHSHSI